MNAQIAVATISGKAYYLIVNELKRKSVPFLSLVPREPVPIEVKVVITTEKEKGLINHEKVIAYNTRKDPATVVGEALQIVQGKECFEKITIGVDPGEVFGLAVLAGGRVVETDNCYSLDETVRRIEKVVKNLGKVAASSITVKIGDGVPACKEKLLNALDQILPQHVMLESVREAGTDSRIDEAKHRRGLRDIVSAIKIAGRNGITVHRGMFNESRS
jgi:hypothetical protein